MPRGGFVPLKDYKNSTKIKDYFEFANLLDPQTRMDFNFIEKKLWDLGLKSREIEISNIIANIYDVDRDIRAIPHPDMARDYRLMLSEGGKRIFFDDWGDGSRYALTILMTAMSITDSGLFIEEIESHQHPGASRKLIHQLVDISRTRNLQVFITTQSYDVFRYLKAVTKSDEFHCYHIQKNPETGEVTATIENDTVKIIRDIFEEET